jgi:hypothetical protein
MQTVCDNDGINVTSRSALPPPFFMSTIVSPPAELLSHFQVRRVIGVCGIVCD